MSDNDLEDLEAKAGRRHSQRDMALLTRAATLAAELSQLVADLGAAAATDATDATETPDATEAVPEMAAMSLGYVKALQLAGDDAVLTEQLSVKRIGRDTVGGYLALWGDESRVDVEREFFTKATDFWDAKLSYPRPLTWDHALDTSFKGEPIIGSIVEAGDDEVGRWYVAQLERNHQYRKAVDALIDKRAVGTSSDSAPQYVVRERTKSGAVWLKQWPLFAAALTTTPCEPRMMEAGSPRWKAISATAGISGISGINELIDVGSGNDDAARTGDVIRLDSRIGASKRLHDFLKLEV